MELDGLSDIPAAKAYIFTHEFIGALGATAEKAEKSILKILSLQLAISTFVFLSLASPETKSTISFFGVSLNNTAGIKEVLLVALLTLGVASTFLTMSRDTMIYVSECVLERLVENKDVYPFARLAIPRSFNIGWYFPAEYNRYIFSSVSRRASGILIALLLGILLTAILLGSVFVSLKLYADIYAAPMLGIWSKLSLLYAWAAIGAGVLMMIRFHLPFPYRDKGELLEIGKLEKTNPAEAKRRAKKLFAPLYR